MNTYGRGPANAIRYGIDQATKPVVVVTMADGSDDPDRSTTWPGWSNAGSWWRPHRATAPAASRSADRPLKGLLSRSAGRSLGTFGRVGTRDATNSFKAYSTDFVHEVGIHSRSGFEIGLELTAKARRLRRPVAELPTIWLDREFGESKFELRAWIPKYLRWYRFAFGPQLSLEEVKRRAARIADLN